MDRKPDTPPATGELHCPFCGSTGRALVGVAEERRQQRLKCRKCDTEYWENQATGLVQMTPGDATGPAAGE